MSGLITASLMEVMADKLAETGAASATMTLGYVEEGEEPPPGTFIPEITFRIQKV
jgi:hypothetical protein